MLDFNELWERLISVDESDTIEAKRGSAIGDSLLETISAFSNEPDLGGGYILLGVAKKEDALFPDYEIVGIENPDDLQNALATRCRNEFSITIRPKITVENHNGKNVLIAFIPEAQPSQKPVYIKKKDVKHGAYRRIASGDQKCVDSDLEELYQARKNISFDSMPQERTSVHDIDERAVNAYRRLRAENKSDAEELSYENEEMLNALGATARVKNETHLTTAGLLLFGKPSALRRELPMMRVDYMRVNGREWLADPERPYDDLIEYREPLMLMIPRIIAQIEEDIPRGFLLPPDSIQRKDVPLIPRRVIREAVVNALMHRSYRIHAPTQIIRFSNRIEIINPGFSLLPQERFGERGATRPRNPNVANVAHEVNFAETKGTGIRRMFDEMKDANLSVPLLESDRLKDSFSITLSTVHFMEKADVEWLKNFANCNLSDDEAKALIFVRKNIVINNYIYRELNRVNIVEASRDLQRLRDLELIETRSKGAGTFYVAGRRMWEAEGVTSQIDAASLPDSGLSGKAGLPDYEPIIPVPILPQHLNEAVAGLGQRATREAMRYVIWKLCGHRAYQITELAAILKRHPKYLSERFISPMIEENELRYTHPEYPTHPHQAYKSVSKSKKK
jgi:ATP-dependent DNA helicase RecG